MVNNMNNQNQGGQNDIQRDKNKSREDQRNKQGDMDENVNDDV